jgi:CheY-like chemotaxis protein
MSKGRRVLLVEDDADLREFFRMCLRQAGYDVVAVADGLQALASIDAAQPEAIVLDLRLPGNRNVTHRLRKPVTGDQLTDTVERCLAAPRLRRTERR